MSEMINVKIDNIPVTVEKGTTILDAARIAGVKIPTLCYLKDINAIGACRVCVCEVKGARSLVAACVYPLDREGTEVFTNTPKILEYRKTTVELILSDHDYNCTSCVRNRSCELQELALELGCDSERFKGEKSDYPVDTSTSYLIRDNNKCVLCRRCVAACKEYQAVAVIGANARGFDTHIACAFETNLSDNPCVGCGQCIEVCPTGALREKDEIDDVIRDLANPDKYVIVGTAPATRIGIGEEFGYPIGSNTEGKMVAALRRLGFNNVFDVDFTADLTIMEESAELVETLSEEGRKYPLFTSCCPGWIRFVETKYPHLMKYVSTSKSPMEMFGAVIKEYYKKLDKEEGKETVSVAIMPCTAKKYEASREEFVRNSRPDVDYVLTSEEVIGMFKEIGIRFDRLEPEAYDMPFSIYSGAGVIFGATGGVTEAAVRRVVADKSPKALKDIEFIGTRGMAGTKICELDLGERTVRIGIVSGLGNAEELIKKIESGEEHFDFVEVMACPGGCVAGAGQPFARSTEKRLRAEGLYKNDKALQIKRSENNPIVKNLYDDLLKNREHELLHVHYPGHKADA